jgi:hypothetical protein
VDKISRTSVAQVWDLGFRVLGFRAWQQLMHYCLMPGSFFDISVNREMTYDHTFFSFLHLRLDRITLFNKKTCWH